MGPRPLPPMSPGRAPGRLCTSLVSGLGAGRRGSGSPVSAGAPDSALKVEANGMSGNASAVAMKLKTESLWELVVQRPIELSISLPGSDSEDPTLGLCLRRARRSSALLVTSVGAGPMEE